MLITLQNDIGCCPCSSISVPVFIAIMVIVTMGQPSYICRHAGVYSAEEVALIMRDKLIRLQSLYIDQFKRLQHVMREKRRKYLHTRKYERNAYGSSSTVKTLNIGTPRLTTVVVLNIKQFNFSLK